MDGVLRARVPMRRSVGPNGESVGLVELRCESIGVVQVEIQIESTVTESVVETIRIPIRRGTAVLQRVITESIETHKNMPKPACPKSAEKLLQKVEIDNNPEGQCSICLDDFEVGMEVCVIIPCSHVYHTDCIMKWLDEKNVCPVCRFAFPAKKN